MIHPGTEELLLSAGKHPSFQLLLQQLKRNERGPFGLSGLVTTAKALYLALLYQATEQPLFVIVDGNKEAETLLEASEVFFELLLKDRDLPPPQLSAETGARRVLRRRSGVDPAIRCGVATIGFES